MKTHLIMPMGGAGSRFKKNSYTVPKPVIKIEGKPFFYWAVRSIEKFVNLEDITFVALKDHIENFGLQELIEKYFSGSHIIVIPEVTPGPVFTCLEGLRDIKDDLPIIFNDCDHMFRCSGLNNMLCKDSITIDGGLVTFKSQSPNFSYVKYDDSGRIAGTVEKLVVSNNAICGAYMFRNADLFRIISDEYLKSCPYEESFISGMYNVMSSHNMVIRDFGLDFHVEFGTPEEYELAKGSSYFTELT